MVLLVCHNAAEIKASREGGRVRREGGRAGGRERARELSDVAESSILQQDDGTEAVLGGTNDPGLPGEFPTVCTVSVLSKYASMRCRSHNKSTYKSTAPEV